MGKVDSKVRVSAGPRRVFLGPADSKSASNDCASLVLAHNSDGEIDVYHAPPEVINAVSEEYCCASAKQLIEILLFDRIFELDVFERRRLLPILCRDELN